MENCEAIKLCGAFEWVAASKLVVVLLLVSSNLLLDSMVYSHRGSLHLIRENMVQSYYISSGKQGRNSWQPTEVRDKLRYQLCITWLLLYNDYTWCHNEVEDRNYDERS